MHFIKAIIQWSQKWKYVKKKSRLFLFSTCPVFDNSQMKVDNYLDSWTGGTDRQGTQFSVWPKRDPRTTCGKSSEILVVSISWTNLILNFPPSSTSKTKRIVYYNNVLKLYQCCPRDSRTWVWTSPQCRFWPQPSSTSAPRLAASTRFSSKT